MPPIWIILHTVSEDFGDERVSPIITEQTCCSVWLRDRGCYSLDQPGPDSVAGRLLSVVKGAPINDEEEVEAGVWTCHGESVMLGLFQNPGSITFWVRKGAPVIADCE